MLYSTVAQAAFVVMLGVCVLAIGFGDGWGRVSAALHLLNWAAVCLLQSDATQGLLHPDFFADVIGAVLAGCVALASGKGWAVCLSAFQILGVVNYIAPLLDRRIHMRAFVTASYVWEAGALLCLLVAAVAGYAQHQRDIRARA